MITWWLNRGQKAVKLLSRLKSQSTPAAPTKAEDDYIVPTTQQAVLLYGVNQPYQLVEDHPVPADLQNDEVLIGNRAVGLNPIDWRGPDFGFGIPELPQVAGRELSGLLVRIADDRSGWAKGDRVIAISTDYRDSRKGAYQDHVVAKSYNIVRLPGHVPFEQGSTIGVAFVTAAVALGICLGVDFTVVDNGPDVRQVVDGLNVESLPKDVHKEIVQQIPSQDRPEAGDWFIIWGGSSTSAILSAQLAKLAGLRVAVVLDSAKHGSRLYKEHSIKPDLVIDSHDPQRAIEIIRSCTRGRKRFGLDTRGKETTTFLIDALCDTPSIPEPQRPDDSTSDGSESLLPRHVHIVALCSAPKIQRSDLTLHTIPIKLFHESSEVGKALTTWLGRLLQNNTIAYPTIAGVGDGLSSINASLDKMRRGEISGGKMVVKI
ncbi:hypothetical protein FVEN_g9592 [Fusarium venenatum]|uniref:Enoyl reductase (ER) domain-containing protein n=1 Tax=Fusarium venenatum TaxID=56646 RepID=A0A2L2TRK9_9HYPO|nr:uncharacterized protein FVRRES_04299 [Fusarium venenatum]KAG8352481.1 hypothetical protein FVEN_g9592 [Fusarium venenatum]KAH7002753.1 chaperonin 10-like protein [Fusarium venenatum]CEI67787.1 unnamed protein product [Fusarium venenatum]